MRIQISSLVIRFGVVISSVCWVFSSMAHFQSSTLFVDNLPVAIRKIRIFNLFSKFGRIRDIFIPNKKSKATNQQFGFVRFFNKLDASSAIASTNGSWLWGQKLIVHIAKYGAGTLKKSRDHHHSDTAHGNYPFQQKLRKWIYRVKNSNTEPSHTHFSHDNSKGVFTGAGKSNILHNIKRKLIQPTGNGWLFRSAVAKIRKLVSPKDLEKIFFMEGMPVVLVKAMGRRYVLITFPNSEDRDKSITADWLSIWFEEIKPWEGEAASEERFVWLSCYGMPLNGWAYANFKLIGDSWGQFLKVDESTLKEESFTKGKNLIVTNQSQSIIGSIELDI